MTMRQRPGTAKGTVFLTLEDGLESLNVIIWPKLTETYRDAMLRSQISGLSGVYSVKRQCCISSLTNCSI